MIREYKKPETLNLLFEINKELDAVNGKNLDYYIGIRLDFSRNDNYECTPPDAIVFAWTGMDGDHFAFLTKDDTVMDLEEAPIVFIQPMDFDNPVKLVANNISDLLSLYINLKEIYVLERFSLYDNKEDFLSDYQKNYLPQILKKKEDITIISSLLLDRIHLRTIEDSYQYIKDLNNKHQ